MGLLPAPASDALTSLTNGRHRTESARILADGPVDESAIGPDPLLRRWLGLAAGVAILLAVFPPIVLLVGRYALWGALEFTLLAFVAPALIVLAAPWSWRGPREARPNGSLTERTAFVRLRHRGQLRAVCLVLPSVAAVVGWRLPAAVDAVVRHRWLVAVEAVTLVAAGVVAWLELLGSPPLQPRSPRPRRIVLAALPMWACWIMSFVLGFSRVHWFAAYHYQAGHGLSFIADQQFTAGLLWFVPFWVFIPYELANIIRWLRGGEDPDMELQSLVRRERGRG